MRIRNCKQTSPTWHRFRLGAFTASEIYKLMGKSINTDTALSYIRIKVAEILTGQSENINGVALDWGKNNEPIAKQYYENTYNVKIKNIGLILPDSTNDYMASPDGLIEGEKIGIEIKCPFNSANHVRNLQISSAIELKLELPQYYWQIMMNLMISEYEKWHFISFDPRFVPIYRISALEINRNDSDCKLLEERIKQAIEIKNKIMEDIK